MISAIGTLHAALVPVIGMAVAASGVAVKTNRWTLVPLAEAVQV